MDEILTETVDAPAVDIPAGASDMDVLDAVVDSHNKTAADVVADADESDQVDPEAEVNPDVQKAVPEVPEVPEGEPAPLEAAEAKETDPDAEDDPYETGLTVAALRKRIDGSPELKAAIAKDPKLRNQLFHSARRSERANQYDEVFQTPALAKEAAQAAQSRYQFADLYNGEDSEKFLQTLANEDLERDAEGRIKLDAANQPVSSGRFQQHMGHYRGVWYGTVLQEAQRLAQSNQTFGDGITGADVQEAVRILQILTEGKTTLTGPDGSAPAHETPAELPAEVKAQLKELETIKAGKVAEVKKSLETFSARISEAERTSLETDVKNLLAKRLPKDAALGEYLKDKIIADTVASVTAMAGKNAAHQNVRSRAIQNASKDDAGMASVLKLSQSFTKELIARELARILTSAAPSVVKQNAELKATVEAQARKKEARTSGGVSTPSRPDAMLTAKNAEALARKAGKQVSDEEIMDQVLASGQR